MISLKCWGQPPLSWERMNSTETTWFSTVYDLQTLVPQPWRPSSLQVWSWCLEQPNERLFPPLPLVGLHDRLSVANLQDRTGTIRTYVRTTAYSRHRYSPLLPMAMEANWMNESSRDWINEWTHNMLQHNRSQCSQFCFSSCRESLAAVSDSATRHPPWPSNWRRCVWSRLQLGEREAFSMQDTTLSFN